jgi:hypothetical protein
MKAECKPLARPSDKHSLLQQAHGLLGSDSSQSKAAMPCVRPARFRHRCSFSSKTIRIPTNHHHVSVLRR